MAEEDLSIKREIQGSVETSGTGEVNGMLVRDQWIEKKHQRGRVKRENNELNFGYGETPVGGPPKMTPWQLETSVKNPGGRSGVEMSTWEDA